MFIKISYVFQGDNIVGSCNVILSEEVDIKSSRKSSRVEQNVSVTM